MWCSFYHNDLEVHTNVMTNIIHLTDRFNRAAVMVHASLHRRGFIISHKIADMSQNEWVYRFNLYAFSSRKCYNENARANAGIYWSRKHSAGIFRVLFSCARACAPTHTRTMLIVWLHIDVLWIFIWPKHIHERSWQIIEHPWNVIYVRIVCR